MNRVPYQLLDRVVFDGRLCAVIGRTFNSADRVTYDLADLDGDLIEASVRAGRIGPAIRQVEKP